jgi:hypothetical protein
MLRHLPKDKRSLAAFKTSNILFEDPNTGQFSPRKFDDKYVDMQDVQRYVKHA